MRMHSLPKGHSLIQWASGPGSLCSLLGFHLALAGQLRILSSSRLGSQRGGASKEPFPGTACPTIQLECRRDYVKYCAWGCKIERGDGLGSGA